MLMLVVSGCCLCVRIIFIWSLRKTIWVVNNLAFGEVKQLLLLRRLREHILRALIVDLAPFHSALV